MNNNRGKYVCFFRTIVWGVVFVFMLGSMGPFSVAQARDNGLNLPTPGRMIRPGEAFEPALMRGVKVFADAPFRFDFFMEPGASGLIAEDLKEQYNTLIKYFLAALTVPEKDLWVNLSPYEADRVIPEKFGLTEMGRDLLAQDYLLKQLTASLMYPEDELGEKFWDRVHEEAYAKYGTADIPVDTFNKVWIIPEKAEVYVQDNAAFVVASQLKVMVKQDYLAMERRDNATHRLKRDSGMSLQLTQNILRDIILPAIEKEVNEGQNFTQLRQIYHSLILATWYKRNLKESFLGKNYVGQNKISGVDIADKNAKEKIYQQYLEAFKKGVYDYIREDYDHVTQMMVPRKYFSGGVNVTHLMDSALLVENKNPAVLDKVLKGKIDKVGVRFDRVGKTRVRKKSKANLSVTTAEENTKNIIEAYFLDSVKLKIKSELEKYNDISKERFQNVKKIMQKGLDGLEEERSVIRNWSIYFTKDSIYQGYIRTELYADKRFLTFQFKESFKEWLYFNPEKENIALAFGEVDLRKAPLEKILIIKGVDKKEVENSFKAIGIFVPVEYLDNNEKDQEEYLRNNGGKYYHSAPYPLLKAIVQDKRLLSNIKFFWDKRKGIKRIFNEQIFVELGKEGFQASDDLKDYFFEYFLAHESELENSKGDDFVSVNWKKMATSMRSLERLLRKENKEKKSKDSAELTGLPLNKFIQRKNEWLAKVKPVVEGIQTQTTRLITLLKKKDATKTEDVKKLVGKIQSGIQAFAHLAIGIREEENSIILPLYNAISEKELQDILSLKMMVDFLEMTGEFSETSKKITLTTSDNLTKLVASLEKIEKVVLKNVKNVGGSRGSGAAIIQELDIPSSVKLSRDAAMVSQKGGIDFNPAGLDIQASGQEVVLDGWTPSGSGLPCGDEDEANCAPAVNWDVPLNGLTPVIFQIIPIPVTELMVLLNDKNNTR